MHQKPKPALNLFLLLFSVYVLTSSGNSTDVTDDGMIRYSITESLWERGWFDLPADMGQRWGVRGVDGRYYTNHGLGQSLLNLPFFVAGKWLGRPKFVVSLVGPAVCALACVVLFRLCCAAGFSLVTSLTVALLAGLCTQLWPESKSPFNHSTETLLSVLTVYLSWTTLSADYRTNRGRMVLAGAALGFAVLTRATTVFWIIPLALFFWMFSLYTKGTAARVRHLTEVGGSFLAGFAPFLAFFFWFNAVRFGSIFEAGYSAWARARNLDQFSNPLWLGLVGELFSPGKGVFLYCPILLLSLLGVKCFWRRQRELAVLTLVVSAFFLVFFAKYKAWHGDNAWGPRYLTFLMPFWLLYFGAWFEEREHAFRRSHLAFGGLVVVASFLVQTAAVLVDKNLHYLRLFEAGVIKDAATYAYPPKLYFRAEYSPLLNRLAEIPEAVAYTARRMLILGNAPGTESEELLSLDFWWLNRGSRGMNPLGCLLLAGPLFFEIILCAGRIRSILTDASSMAGLLSVSTIEDYHL